MLPVNAISVIIPLYNNAAFIDACLTAIHRCSPSSQIIVVDDASTDGSADIAARYPSTLFRLGQNRGAAYARNFGAKHADSDILFFLDSDILVDADSLERIIEKFTSNHELDALFGSYQKNTAPANYCSQYKNLLHHFTHQISSEEAATFCGGYGAVRRQVFEALNGFDESYRNLEDIEFGYRMFTAGYRIRLEKNLQFTHLKRYTFASLVRSDVFGRAIPWTRLMLNRRIFRSDLNTRWSNCGSVILVYLSLLLLFFPAKPIVWIGIISIFVLLNFPFLSFVHYERGLGFALRTLVMSWLFYFYSGIGLLTGIGSIIFDKVWNK